MRITLLHVIFKTTYIVLLKSEIRSIPFETRKNKSAARDLSKINKSMSTKQSMKLSVDGSLNRGPTPLVTLPSDSFLIINEDNGMTTPVIGPSRLPSFKDEATIAAAGNANSDACSEAVVTSSTNGEGVIESNLHLPEMKRASTPPRLV